MTPGIHQLKMADYLADPCDLPSLSGGCAHTLLTESPLHAWHKHPRLGAIGSEPSTASDIGTMAHDLLLGGEGKICEIRPEDYRSKPTKDNPEGSIPVGWTNTAIRSARDMARAKGLVPILSADMASVRAMVAAARKFVEGSKLRDLFLDGAGELTVIAQDGQTWLRTRPDWLNQTLGVSLSYKTTTGSVAPDKFGRLVDSEGYGFSLMFYERALALVEPRAKVRHIILAQEQRAPYACAFYELSAAKAAIERNQVRRAIALWQRCLESDEWPGYSRDVVSLEPKPWDLAAEEERLQAEELAAM